MGPDDHIKADPPTYPVGQVCQHGTLARKCDECYSDWQLLELCKVIAAQAATIATLEANKIAAHEVIRILRAECRRWREADEYDFTGSPEAIATNERLLRDARAAVDSAHALEDK